MAPFDSCVKKFFTIAEQPVRFPKSLATIGTLAHGYPSDIRAVRAF